MKKALALILTLALCLSLAACGKKESDPAETISLEQLLADSNNPAKIALNEGKETTVYGQITELQTDYCLVESFLKDFTLQVFISTEEVAKMNMNQFVALDIIIGSLENKTNMNPSVAYVANIKKILDLTKSENKAKMNQYVSTLCENFTSKTLLSENLNITMLLNYMQLQGNSFQAKSDDDLHNYLIGKWRYAGVQTLDFQADGNCTWHFYTQTPLGERERNQNQTWTVNNCRLQCIWGEDFSDVYIISQKLCFIDGTLSEKIGA